MRSAIANGEHIDFWHFLQGNRVVIPQIQRDYAQGRKGREELRQKFLSAFKHALSGESEGLELDFVYGIACNGEFEPLDGQQRLTTAWLLCWYLAWRGGRLMECVDGKDRPTKETCTLAHFVYRTRKTTDDFCRHLLRDGSRIVVMKGGRLDDAIKNQTWFCDEWKYDPSIDAMLRMLSGTRQDEKCKETYLDDDAIEKVFAGCDINEMLSVIKNGRNKGAGRVDWPIMLWRYPLQHSQSEAANLYVKMNARGKPLSSFENFKADLSSYVKKNEPGIENRKAPNDRFSYKIDVNWTNFFWRGRSRGPVRIDEIYFAFINRFCLTKNMVRSCAATMVEKDPGFRFLYGDEGDDLSLVYKAFQPYYSNSLQNDGCAALEMVLDGMLAYSGDISCDLQQAWKNAGGEKFNFVPVYEPNSDKPERIQVAPTVELLRFSQLTQKGRIAFGAFCRFFELSIGNSNIEKKLLEWKRIVWNVLEDASVDNVGSMISGVRFFEALGEHCADIEEYLAGPEAESIQNGFSGSQVREECLKCQKMMGENGDEWRQLILRAEGHPLLKGNLSSIFDEEVSLEGFEKRINAFFRLFPDVSDRPPEYFRAICRALISYGDCSLQRSSHWQFPVTKDVFEECLRGGRANKSFTEAFHRLLERAVTDCSINGLLSPIKLKHDDWRYYFVEYAETFVNAGNGYYHWSDKVDMPSYLMNTVTLSGWHCNPFLLTICKIEHLDENIWISAKGGGDGLLKLNEKINLLYSDEGYVIGGSDVAELSAIGIKGEQIKVGKVRVKFKDDRVRQGCDLIRNLRKLLSK